MTRTAAEDQESWNRYWTRWAAAYDEHQLARLALPGEREAWSRTWREALPTGTRTVLDLGTGSGNVALLLAADGFDVTGIDLAEGMLERARAKLAGHPRPPIFLTGDAVDPPFAPGSFDAIVSRYLLWTLRDAGAALRRWHELLRPGGVLVAVEGGGVAPPDPQPRESARQVHFADAYNETAFNRLDFGRADAVRIREAWEGAGFVDVRVDPLTEILALDRAHGTAPGHSPQLLHRFSARRPG
jgi:SAM-dependent methyltransferase